MDATETARRVAECRVCGAADWQEVVSFGLMPLANAYLDAGASHRDEPHYPLDVISCRSCRLLSLTYVVDPAMLYRNYLYVTSDSETMTTHMRYIAAFCCEQFSLQPGDLVIEVGSNTGDQLRAFRASGLRVLGIDPASNLAAIANDGGVETLPEFFSSETAADVADVYGHARMILARHVFAHIDDLADVVAAVRGLLSTDGVFAIEVPYAVDLLREVAFDTIYHEHLSYFFLSTFVTLFERHGMRVLDVQRFPVHGGSILVSVGLAESRQPTRSSVRELLALEERSSLREDAIYEHFADRVSCVRDELSCLVRGVAAEGSRIAGYGAPAKGNTILNVCGLGRDEIAFCSDTTKLKQGKLLPGTYIPVVSPEEACTRRPDYYLLLAWNYAREIIRKESAFLANGGRFIVPIPRPATVSADSEPGLWATSSR